MCKSSTCLNRLQDNLPFPLLLANRKRKSVPLAVNKLSVIIEYYEGYRSCQVVIPNPRWKTSDAQARLMNDNIQFSESPRYAETDQYPPQSGWVSPTLTRVPP